MMIFTIWWVGVLVTFLYSAYKAAQYWADNYEAVHEASVAHGRKYFNVLGEDGEDGYAYWYRMRRYSGTVLLVLALSAASVLAWITAIPLALGFYRGKKNKQARQSKEEALKILAEYEENPEARRALQRGDVDAYVDIYLDLEKPIRK